MRNGTRFPASDGYPGLRWGLASVSLVGLLWLGLGCGDQAPTGSGQPSANGEPGVDAAGADGLSGQPGPNTNAPLPGELPPAPTIPVVELTDELAATCLVKVGDTLPQAAPVDFSGQPRALGSLYAPRLSVVCFWQAGQSDHARMANLDMLEFLKLDVADPFKNQGVGVVGVNVAETPDTASQAITAANASFTNLLDPQGNLFSQIATAKLPRIYLVDSQGKVLWFDLEYSEATRNPLIRAITVALDESGESAEE